MPIPNEIPWEDWKMYLKQSYMMEMESLKPLHIFQTNIILPRKNYTLIEKTFEGDKELFTGELMSSDLHLNGILQMRSKKEGDFLYSKFYNSKERIKSFNFLREQVLLILLEDGRTLILKETP